MEKVCTQAIKSTLKEATTTTTTTTTSACLFTMPILRVSLPRL
jgi:hypothetical protein